MEKEPLESNGSTKTEHIKIKNKIEAVQHMKNMHYKAIKSTKQLEIPSHVPKKSSASWSVHQRKEDQNPGFYSDYSRPRTRPPSHN